MGQTPIALIVIWGLVLVVGAALSNQLPEGFVRIEGPLPELWARLIAFPIGLLLLWLARGMWRFETWAWWLTTSIATLHLTRLCRGLFEPLFSTGPVRIDGWALALSLALPYLWLHRSEYGIGRQRADPEGDGSAETV